MKNIIQLLVFSLAFIGCQDMGDALPGESEAMNVKEAVYRYQLNNARLNRIYYLATVSVDKSTNTLIYQDPTDEFINRFQGIPQKVKKVSQCEQTNYGVKDKSTGELGVILRINTITWLSKTEAKVDGGYEENGLSAAGGFFTVKYQSNKWVVIEFKLISIS